VFGPMAYLMSAVRVLGDTPPKMRVTCEDGRVEEGVCVMAGNGSLYGGQLKLFSKADNCDEMLDILLFTEVGYKQVMDSLMGIATGDIDAWNSSVIYLQSRSFHVECDREVPMEADGEWIGRVREVSLKPAKRKLRVVAPENLKTGLFSSLVKALVKAPRKNEGL
jgi:diacylglycerol kinase (ATP)